MINFQAAAYTIINIYTYVNDIRVYNLVAH